MAETETARAHRWQRRTRAAATECVAALLLFAVAMTETATGSHWVGPRWLTGITLAAVTLPLAVLADWPEAVVGWVFGVMVVWSAIAGTSASIAVFFALLVASFGAGYHVERRRVLFLAAAAVTCGVFALRARGDQNPGDYAFTFGLMTAAYVFGALLRSRAKLAVAEADRADRAEEQQQLVTQVALADERARIAREMHDVVAHAVSVIVVQSVAGRTVVATDTAEASRAFDTIEHTGQQALAELRRLLGVLRTADESALLAPQPTLARVDELVSRAEAAGLRASLAVTGTPRALPPAVDVSAYRIIQEALTNALKHAGPTNVTIDVAYTGDAVRLRVADDGGAGSPVTRRQGEGGHGIVGMRERAALCGGTLSAAPRPGGGFVVSAELPSECA